MMGAQLRMGLWLAAILCTANMICAGEPASDKKPAKGKEEVKETEKEVPFPELPEKAGKISEKAPKKFTKTKSGLKYRILRESKGISPIASDAVEINYHMWLDDGKVVWSCYEDGNTQTFKLSRSMAGLREGLQLVNEGGMIELEIPAKLAFGDDPPQELGVPANATLHVVAEMVDVKGLEYTP